MTAGWDNGFYLTSADGNFRLNIKGAVQVRFAHNTQNNSPTDNDRWGFENRRTALKFGGHVVDPSWKYFIHGNFSAGTGMFALLDAFAEKDLGIGWSVRGGKFKLPFMREQLVAYTKLLPVERSLVSSAYGAGRSQGVRVAYQGDRFNFAAAVSDGLGGIGGTTATAITYDTEYAVSARVETLLDGGWKQFGDFTSFNDDEYGLLIGAALHVENGEYGTAAIESQILRWTMDASVEFGGANVFTALVANHVDPNTGGGPSLDQYGLIIQGGLLVTDDLEVFGRYEWSDDDAATENLSLITIGVVKYLKNHQLKWTNDVGVALSEVTGMFADAGASWRTDTPGQDGQVVFRSQFQLVF